MRYAQFQRVPKQLVLDVGSLNTIIKHALRKLPSKSVRVFNKEVILSEQDSDNFVKDLVTVIVQADVYKAPRIVTKQKHHRKWNARTFRAIKTLYS